jgi:Ca2+-binding EF-hand superfamily protein
LVQFTWTKIKDFHPNTTHAFRIFDVKGKGKIRKNELSAGLEKLHIRLSSEDFNKVWSYLDHESKGRVTFA